MIPFFLLFDLFTTPVLLFHFYRSLKLRRGLDLGQSNNVIFGIEIFSCLPFFLIIHYYSLSEWFLLFYFLRMIKLLRISKLFSIMDGVGKLPKALKFSEVFLFSYFIVHIVGLVWVALHPKETNLSIVDTYVKGIYWVITTMTTIGYGDITPQNTITRIYTMIVMISGVGVYGFVIGHFAKILGQESKFKETQKEKMFNLIKFMKYYKVPKALEEESINFMGHISGDRLTEDDTKIIAELPPSLQDELKVYIKVKIIDSIPLFRGTGKTCEIKISKALKEKNYNPGELIIKKGDIGHEMFIIDHGQVDQIIEGDIVQSMTDGEFFGELALLEKAPRISDIKAKTYCKIYCLESEDFLNLTKEYPILIKRIKKIIESYKSYLNKRS